MVTAHPAKLFAAHGKPKFIRADNGGSSWPPWCRTGWRPSKSTRRSSPRPARSSNCYIERFNGSMRRELLNGELFHWVLEAKVVIEAWLELYNTRRPHRGLAGQTPAAYGKMARSRMNDDPCGGGA